MPEMVNKTVEARNVRAGDVFGGRKVDGVSHKAKYTYLTLAGVAKQARLEHAEEVVVGREVPTAEEERAASEAFANERIARMIRRAEAALNDARQDVAKAIGNADVVQTSSLARLIDAQHAVAIARQVTAVAENRGVSLLEAARVLVPTFTEALVNNYGSPTYSGGFTVSNADLQAGQEARRAFLQEVRWLADF